MDDLIKSFFLQKFSDTSTTCSICIVLLKSMTKIKLEKHGGTQYRTSYIIFTNGRSNNIYICISYKAIDYACQ